MSETSKEMVSWDPQHAVDSIEEATKRLRQGNSFRHTLENKPDEVKQNTFVLDGGQNPPDTKPYGEMPDHMEAEAQAAFEDCLKWGGEKAIIAFHQGRKGISYAGEPHTPDPRFREVIAA